MFGAIKKETMEYEVAGESPIEQEIVDESLIKRRSVHGILVLLFRTGLLQVVAIVATFLLTILLEPAHYGVFAITAAAVDILVYFSDIGLAGALIQKKQISKDDLVTTFTVQQFLSLLLVVIGFGTTSVISHIYSLSLTGIWLFRALLISFFLSTLKTIPSIQLERKLEFGKLIIPQIIENISFYGAAVFFAWKGYGVTSFTIAVILRSVLGLIAIYIVRPWKPSLGFRKSSFKSLASFGVPFQLNSLLGLVKDRLLVIYYGAVLPATQVGYLQWAERWSLFPNRIVVDNIGKVTFPAYSRLQSKKAHLVRAIEKSLFFTSLVIFPVLVGMIATAPAFVSLIPRYGKWKPALLALVLFSINAMWSSISTTITNSFAAMGKISINLKLMLMWTTLTWLTTPLLVWKIGYNGVALASALVATSSIIPLIIIKNLLHIKIFKNLGPQLISSVLMGFAVWYLNSKLPFTFYNLLFTILLGVILYGLFIIAFTGNRVKTEYETLRRLIRP